MRSILRKFKLKFSLVPYHKVIRSRTLCYLFQKILWKENTNKGEMYREGSMRFVWTENLIFKKCATLNIFVLFRYSVNLTLGGIYQGQIFTLNIVLKVLKRNHTVPETKKKLYCVFQNFCPFLQEIFVEVSKNVFFWGMSKSATSHKCD